MVVKLARVAMRQQVLVVRLFANGANIYFSRSPSRRCHVFVGLVLKTNKENDRFTLPPSF